MISLEEPQRQKPNRSKETPEQKFTDVQVNNDDAPLQRFCLFAVVVSDLKLLNLAVALKFKLPVS